MFADGLRQRFVDQLAASGYILAFGVIVEASFLHGVVVLGCIGHVLVVLYPAKPGFLIAGSLGVLTLRSQVFCGLGDVIADVVGRYFGDFPALPIGR